VTRTDSGGESFNFSEIGGECDFIGHFKPIRTIPREIGRYPNTMSVWGTQVGYDTLTIVGEGILAGYPQEDQP